MVRKKENNLIHNDQVVELLSTAVYRSVGGVKYVPELLKDLIRSNRWQERIIRRTGKLQTFANFEDFVTAEPLEGLGTTVETLRFLCASDSEAIRLVNELIPQQNGSVDEYIVTKLAQENTDLLVEVNEGKISTRDAATQAGFRKTRVRFYPGDVEQTALIIVRWFKRFWGEDWKKALLDLIRLLEANLK